MKHILPISFVLLGMMVLAPSVSAAARCPSYLLKSPIKELCWEGAWRPYERDDWRDFKNDKDKYKPGRNKPRWRFKSGQGGNMKNK